MSENGEKERLDIKEHFNLQVAFQAQNIPGFLIRMQIKLYEETTLCLGIFLS